MMANRVAGKIKLQSVDQLLGVPEISGTQEIEIVRRKTSIQICMGRQEQYRITASVYQVV